MSQSGVLYRVFQPHDCVRHWTLLLAIGIAMSACRATTASPQRPPVRLIVSSAGGVDYTELLREYGLAIPSVSLQPYDTSSSVAALTAIQHGQADLGFLM